MNLQFNTEAWEEYCYWQEQDKKKLKRVNELLKDIARNGYLMPTERT
ncbi:MAG: type II toxin-antitoxin system YoeB family toxin [Fibromonadales bacterium]|nr:type II toxin-antitoxin system YoeB family toxin [Fibromonadales bacterium]